MTPGTHHKPKTNPRRCGEENIAFRQPGIGVTCVVVQRKCPVNCSAKLSTTLAIDDIG